METKKFVFVLQEEKQKKSEQPRNIPFNILFFSLVFNIFFAFCVIATFFLPPEKLELAGKMVILSFCFVVVIAAMGVLIGILGPPKGED